MGQKKLGYNISFKECPIFCASESKFSYRHQMNQVSKSISLLKNYEQNSFLGNTLDKKNKNGGRNWVKFLM